MTDEDLARKAQKGDAEAFMELAHRHQHPVYRLCYRFTGTAEDADDLAQECFIRAYRQMGKFDCRRPFTPWLMRLATNVCINDRKTVSRQRQMEQPWHEQYEDLVSVNSEDEALQRLERKEILFALQKLRPEIRVPVILRLVMGHSFREISERTGVKLPTVAFRVTRGIEMLREVLSADKEVRP